MKKIYFSLFLILTLMLVFTGCSNEHMHKVTKVEEVAATCTKDGNTEHWVCSDCGKKYADFELTEELQVGEEIIPALGHDLININYQWNEELTEVVAMGVCSRNNEHKIEEKVEVAVSEVAANCLEDGLTTYTATFTNPQFEMQVRTETIPASHKWDEVEYVWSEDLSTVTATRVCKEDASHVETETVDTTLVTIPENCLEDGLNTFSATFENEAFKEQIKEVVIPMHHTYSSECDVTCDIDGCTGSRESATPHTDVEPFDGDCDLCDHQEIVIVSVDINTDSHMYDEETLTFTITPRNNLIIHLTGYNFELLNDYPQNHDEFPLWINLGVVMFPAYNDWLEVVVSDEEVTVIVPYDTAKRFEESVTNGIVDVRLFAHIIKTEYKILVAEDQIMVESVGINTDSAGYNALEDRFYLTEENPLILTIKGHNLDLVNEAEKTNEGYPFRIISMTLALSGYCFEEEITENEYKMIITYEVLSIYYDNGSHGSLGYIINSTSTYFDTELYIGEYIEFPVVELTGMSIDETSPAYDAETKTFTITEETPLVLIFTGTNLDQLDLFPKTHNQFPLYVTYFGFGVGGGLFECDIQIVDGKAIVTITYDELFFAESGEVSSISYSNTGKGETIVTEYFVKIG